VTAVISCVSCETGTYSDQTASTSVEACVECGVGRFSAAVAATSSTDCVACDLGKFQNEPGSTICKSCDRGKYAESEGQPLCNDCTEGTWSNSTGLLTRFDRLPCYDSAVKFSFLSLAPFDSKESCICREGEILVEYDEGGNDESGFIGECKACEEISEEGSDCNRRGVNLNNLKVSERRVCKER